MAPWTGVPVDRARPHASHERTHWEEGPTGSFSSGPGRSVVGHVLAALALSELASHRAVEAVSARRATHLALEGCSSQELGRWRPLFEAAGLRPHRVVPMLEGLLLALPLLEGAGCPWELLDAWTPRLATDRDAVLVQSVHVCLFGLHVLLVGARTTGAGQESPVGGMTGPDRGLRDRSTCNELAVRCARVMSPLRAAVERLGEWPLRRRWFALDQRCRLAGSGRDRGSMAAPARLLRPEDLALCAGLVARYPDERYRILRMLASSRPPSGARPVSLGGARQLGASPRGSVESSRARLLGAIVPSGSRGASAASNSTGTRRSEPGRPRLPLAHKDVAP